jgi:heat shock protein HslJ
MSSLLVLLRVLPGLLLVAGLLGACASPGATTPEAAPVPRGRAFPPGPPPPPMPDADLDAAAAPAAPVAPAATLVGPLWAWQSTAARDGTRTVARGPDRYTLQFRPDGRVDVRADCNRGTGAYAVEAQRLTIGPITLARKPCAPGSQDAAFLRGVIDARGHRLDRGELAIEVGEDAAIMRFRPLPR